MGLIKRKVHGIDYAYFRDSDRHETVLGRFGDKDNGRKALVKEKEALLRQMQSVQTKLTEVDASLATYGESAKILCRPFVKWAGGKTQLIDKMKKHFPEKFTHYYEAFLGGGAVFFYLASTRPAFPATLSDTNHDLINAYEVIRDDVDGLIGDLTRRKAEFDAQETKSAKNDYFLQIRKSPPDIDSEPIARAGWFIFLNKTAFNGLYRVNSNDTFNVPFGGYSNPTFYERDNLLSISTLLKRKGVELVWADYAEVLKDAKEGSFVYLDPPYFSADNKGFTAYNASLFTKEDQVKLAGWFKTLTERKVKVLLSNSKSDFIEAEIKKHETKDSRFTMDTLTALRVINCKGSNRTGVQELLIKNY